MLHPRHQTSDALLELAVLDSVDKRVDAAVGEHQYHGEVVEPPNKSSLSIEACRKYLRDRTNILTKSLQKQVKW